MTYTVSDRQLERDRFRKSSTRRSTLVAAVSTVVVAAVLYFAVTRTPGWPRVRESFFSPSVARKAFPDVIDGLWLNIRVMVVCEIIILVLGMLIAVARTLRGPVFFPVRLLATAYTDLFRGLPVILVLLLLGLGVPGLRLSGLPTSVVIYGAAALVLCYSAYVAEVFRAGIESVHPSQRAAARSLGLSTAQSMRHVVLPQAVRRVIPPLLNDLVSLQKDSGLISVLGAVDAVQAAQIQTAKTLNFTPYVLAGLLFVILTIPMTRLTDYVAGRMNQRQFQGGTV
ncbi:MAG TPA: amino acid ABC transporter permease [Mycobacteriales bacterium]|jgi:polar amino acid transport system permease protein|nr:amino acid ABC transporter permease [Mycobacteriales bacterium]